MSTDQKNVYYLDIIWIPSVHKLEGLKVGTGNHNEAILYKLAVAAFVKLEYSYMYYLSGYGCRFSRHHFHIDPGIGFDRGFTKNFILTADIMNFKATRKAADRQFSYSEQLNANAPPNPAIPLSLSVLSGGNAIGVAAPNTGIYGQNILEGADRGSLNDTRVHFNTLGVPQNYHDSRNLYSPYGHPGLEYVYHGSPETPSLLLDPGFSMAGNNDLFQQPSQTNISTNHSPFVTDAAMQPGYPVPGTNVQVPFQRFSSGTRMEKSQVQAQQVVQGLYSIPPTPELQCDDLWANLESDMFAQESMPQYDIALGDVGMVEGFGFEPPRHGLPDSSSWNPTPGFQKLPGPHSAIEGDDNTWAILSQALPDVGADGSSSYEHASLASTSTGQGNELQGFLSRQAQHEVAQDSIQGLYPVRANEFGVINMMDMVIEDSISDGISSTEDPSWRGVAPTQIPHGYAVQSNTSGLPVVTGAGGPGSSHRENNFRAPQQQQQLLEYRETFGAPTGGAAAFNGGPVENDFTQLMGPGLSAIRQLGEPRWALQLLNLCASAIASENVTRTQHLMWVLNDLASVGGDVNQRFAAYGLRALYMRVTNQMEAIQTFLRPRHHDQEIQFGPKMVHRALVRFHEHVPWHQNCYSASSQTLLEVCAGKSRLHLIDIGAGKAIEWPIFIDALVSRPGGPPSILRITMIKDRRREEQNMNTANPVNSEAADFMKRLVKFARVLGLHVEVNVVGKALECVTREDLRLNHGEILAVVCQFRLHRLSDEVTEGPRSTPLSNSFLTPRDEFIDFLFSLNPHVFIMSDNDADHSYLEFLPRFQSCMSFWWLFWEMLDSGYAGRDTQERQIIEYEAGSMLLNMVACEGVARIERNEPYSRWSRRIQRAGFVPKDMSDDAKKVCQNLVHNHGQFWDVVFDANSVNLQWRKVPMTFTSVWATPDHCSKNSCKCSMLHN